MNRLARPQRGHFDLGTGYHGDVWLDLDALFLRPALLSLGQASTTMPAALSVPFYATGTIESRVWPASDCPLCASGLPLTDPSSHD